MRRRTRAIALVAGLALAALGRAQEPAPAPQGLKIIVLDGEDGVNIIKKKSAVRPVVEVRDKNNLPVGGATVVFLTPNSGPSAIFHGTRSLTVLTDSNGHAAASAMRPVGEGRFTIRVNASFKGMQAQTTIAQTNYVSTAAASAAGASGAAAGASAGAVAGISVGVITGVATAVAVTAVSVLVARRNTSNSNSGPQGAIGLGSGGPTIGAPPAPHWRFTIP